MYADPDEGYDADDGDMVVHLGLFGKVVYVMNEQTAARFEEMDEIGQVRRDGILEQMEDRLRTIGRQNAVLAETVEVLGGYVNASVEHLQAHVTDPDAHS